MLSATLFPSPFPFPFPCTPRFIKTLSKYKTPKFAYTLFKRNNESEKKSVMFKSSKCVLGSVLNPDSPSPAGPSNRKLRSLASEFRSLSEPIDRVKRLLHYAAILPPLEASARVEANRVTGCTAQVWVDARLDDLGRMRFGADSDSEITKGFCSCLVWALDRAEPEEVLALRTEDLAELNLGLGGGGRAHSRVNTWHNVLVSMQKRTTALVAEKDATAEPKPFSFSDVRYKLCNEGSSGCEFIIFLEVDFMSEKVRTILDQAAFGKDGVCVGQDFFDHKIMHRIKEIYSAAFVLSKLDLKDPTAMHGIKETYPDAFVMTHFEVCILDLKDPNAIHRIKEINSDAFVATHFEVCKLDLKDPTADAGSEPTVRHLLDRFIGSEKVCISSLKPQFGSFKLYNSLIDSMGCWVASAVNEKVTP
ncbi:quinolinate synthase, chloroplastic-like [Malania oleifera]|uniref:quinolinate synthase, chloroplastic-like n=1 Tax=Malania oleifera TaxID=397392 RepID=UPI0025ADDCA6|nr:quinolinate synthase, chloroplastic-like [Malania oleifera]